MGGTASKRKNDRSQPLEAPPGSAATLEHCRHCFEHLEHVLTGGPAPAALASAQGRRCGLFVTLTADDRLRGCIGMLSPGPLAELGLYARKAAFKDSRFSPMTAADLRSGLTCGVSLLFGHEEARDAWDWTVGTHGITLAYRDGIGAARSATFLPEVCASQGWSQEECLRALVRKSGGAPIKGSGAAFWARVTVTRYRSSKVELTWDDYVARRHAGHHVNR